MDQARTCPYYIFGKGCNNYSRLSRLITEVCSDLIRIIFSMYIPPTDLAKTLTKNRYYLKQRLNNDQKILIYQNGNTVRSSLTTKDLDISVMIKILRRLGYVSQKSDIRIAACVDIIRNRRNDTHSHTKSGRVDDDEFKIIWNELESAVVELEEKLIGGDLFQRAVVYLYAWNNDKLKETQHENRSIKAPGDTSDESNLTHYDDMGARVRFANLFEELVENIPQDKLEQMKDVIKNSCKGVNTDDINKAGSARNCLNILKDANHFTSTDVIYIQYVLKKIGCGGLHEKCFEYARKQNALCFHEAQLEGDGKIVHIHVPENLENYEQSFINEIIQAVADISGCSTAEIQLGGICPSNSFLVSLSLKTVNLRSLLTMDQQDKDKLSRLNIDYIIADLNVIFLERSKDLEEKLIIYFGAKTKSRCTDMNWKGNHAAMPTPKQKSTELLTQSYTSTEKDLKKKLDESPTGIISVMEKGEKTEFDDSATPPTKKLEKFIYAIELTRSSDITHIAIVKEHLWVIISNCLVRIDRKGKTIDSVEDAMRWHGSFDVEKGGCMVYVHENQRVLKRKIKDKTETILKLKKHKQIECIHCSHANNDILIVIRDLKRDTSEIARYDEKFENSFKVIEKGSLFEKWPVYITENTNGDIVTSDHEKEAVVAIDKSGCHRFEYNGLYSGDRFFPADICTDNIGRILVVNIVKQNVHVLDENGCFLAVLFDQKEYNLNWGLCVDNKQNVYVEVGKSRIEAYEYLT